MSVAEVTQALGSWSLTLKPETPRSVLDALDYFGHVAITTRRSEAAAQLDSLLTSARYVGVVRNIARDDATQPVTVGGSGMGFWLGDENDVGAVYQTPVALAGANFAAAVAALLPSSGAVTSGVVGSVAGTITQTFQWTSPRSALTQLCSLFSSGVTAAETVEWRVNGNATLDIGPVSGLYRTNPVAALVRRNPGVDMSLRSLPGSFQNAGDVMNYATGVALLAAGTSGSTAVGTATLPVIPYKDLHGNTVQLTAMVSQSTTDPTNADAAAQDALNAVSLPKNALTLSTDEFDVRGVVAAGDYVWVQDPDAGLVDPTQEVRLRGDVLTPVLLRCVELDWPVTQGMGAAFRDKNGAWYDLSDYIEFEDGVTNVIVGALSSALAAGGEPIGSRPIADPSVPDVPVFGAFTTASYQSPSDGATKAQIQATWSTPLNTDGSTIVDGDHYEVQYRPGIGIFATNPSYAQLATAGYTYAALAALGGTYNQLIPPAVAEWKVTFVGWGTNTLLVQELTPGVEYEFQIRAVDTATPPNAGAWSATTIVQASRDTIAPQTPDAPTVAANLLALQVTWDCGSASGGTYNQASDLNHIEVHGSYDPLFAPTPATKLGSLTATIANIGGQIPVVGAFTIPPGQPPAQNMFVRVVAVDTAGNRSNPSASAGATILLLPDEYIESLTATKITAGTIEADILVAGMLATALAGARAGLDITGLWAYDAAGDRTFFANAATGQVTLSSSGAGQRVALDTLFDLTPYGVPEIVDALVFYTDAVSTPAVLAGYTTAEGVGGTLVMSAAPAALSAALGAWGVASNYAPALSLKSAGAATLAYVDSTSTNYSGGAVQATPQLLFLGLANESAAAGGWYLQTVGASITEVHHEMVGYFTQSGAFQPNAGDGLFPGSITGLSAASTSLSWSWGPTMVHNMIVTAQSSYTGSGTVASKLSSNPNATGFSFALASAYSGAWGIVFQASGYN